MNSSISSSERLKRLLPEWLLPGSLVSGSHLPGSYLAEPDGHGEAAGRDWARFCLTLLGSAFLTFALLYAAILLLDPYDSGRFSPTRKHGVLHKGPRMAQVSRARDPAIEFAIFGNSHVQLLSPERIGAATGMKGASLIVPATGPKEQFRILEWFLAHRRTPPKAMIIGVDNVWCRADGDTWQDRPFPFWLYSLAPLDYLTGLVRLNSLEDAGRRARFLLGKLKPERADGYWDYEENRVWRQDYLDSEIKRDGPYFRNRAKLFPAAAMLEALFREIPDQTKVVLIFPPLHSSHVPKPGSPDRASLDACKAAFSRVAAERPGTTVLDFVHDDEDARDDRNWFDVTHYRQSIAHRIEDALIPTIRSGP